MRKGFYLKLAAGNIKKNGKVYLPFLLTCICTVMVSYIMQALTKNKGLSEIRGGDDMKTILMLGYIVMCIFSVIFLFYTNSFLMKRRKKEFGLFNILGMEKKHIAKVIFYETFYIGVISIALGLLLGVLLNKLCVLLILRMMQTDVVLGFEISGFAMIVTVLFFGGIFLLMLLNNIRQVHLTNPIELLRGGNVGEKEPKTKWIMAVLGLIFLGAGYYLAITTENPIGALMLFFIAVILVMIGTYFLFAAGSIAALKIMRKNKGYYYQPKHFVSVSGMIYRMKQNAVGLANICILSTGVLLLISITVSLYAGTEDAIQERYPYDMHFSTEEYSDEAQAKIDGLLEEAAAKEGVSLERILHYRALDFTALNAENGFEVKSAYAESPGTNMADISALYFLSVDDYNAVTGAKESLKDNQILVIPAGDCTYEKDRLQIFDYDFHVKELEDIGKAHSLIGETAAVMWDSYYLIVKDTATLEDLQQKQAAVYVEYPSHIRCNYGIDFVADTPEEQQLAFVDTMWDSIKENTVGSYRIESRVRGGNQVRAIYSGFLFIGILLGMIFFMATALIIYYKQISEGYDDKERFEIMQKVGMSKQEVKKSIHSQILSVFFLPLVVAGIHLTVAFPMVRRLMSTLMLTNQTLFILCTITCFILFAICYALIYAATAKTYYKIVSPNKN